MKDKNHMIVLIDAEKTFDKIQQLFMMKALNKLGREGNYLNMMKTIGENPQLSLYSVIKKTESFPP